MMLLLPFLLQTAEPTELDCEDPQAQIEMNLCAARDFEASDAELNRQWARTVAVMKALDAQIDREHDRQPGHYETLLDAQRAWLRYRDAHCLGESFFGRGGSMQPMLVSTCKTYLTEVRIQQLQTMAAEY